MKLLSNPGRGTYIQTADFAALGTECVGYHVVAPKAAVRCVSPNTPPFVLSQRRTRVLDYRDGRPFQLPLSHAALRLADYPIVQKAALIYSFFIGLERHHARRN